MLTTPFFELDLKKLAFNYTEFKNKLTEFFARNEIAYSIKTNSLPAIVRELAAAGSGMEAASLKELKTAVALKAAAKTSFLVLNSPAKTPAEIRFAEKNNALIHADSFQELDALAKIAPKARVGLRLNYGVNKFGFDDIYAAVEYARVKKLEVISLHSHPGTRISLDKYREYAEHYAANAVKALDAGALLEYYDVGGGFPDHSTLGMQRISWQDYFNELKTAFAKHGLDGVLAVEPGRALVADAMELEASVRYIKQVNNVNYAIIDAGINYLSPITLARYEITKENKTAGAIGVEKDKKQYIIAGPLLFSNDKLGFYHGDLKAGDVLRVKNVGAYCLSLAWEISYGKPRVVVK